MLATLSWWFVVQLFGLAALPLAWRLFGYLPSRGYPLAKVLGLLLVSYFVWLGASIQVLPNTTGGILVALIGVTALSGWLGREGLRRGPAGESRPLIGWLRENRWPVLAVELLFLLVFVAWSAFRAFNPDIAGTEKPMEFAFINGVLRSRLFPPQDPWLAGYAISYYHFGYVMLGILTRLSGVDPAVGFNLGVALWYALVMIGAFGLVYDLVRVAAASSGSKPISALAPKRPGPNPAPSPEPAKDLTSSGRRVPGSRDRAGASVGGYEDGQGRGIRYGLLGAVFVGFLGNLEGVVELAYNRSLVPLSWIRWLDIKQLMDTPPSGNLTGGFWWWWRASRVIHDKDLLGNSVEVIDEFPSFSFLLGDMHPHVLALPFVLLAIGLALNILLGARSSKLATGDWMADGRPRALSRFWRFLGDVVGLGTPGVLLYAVALGALAFLNTWDFPIYVGLVTLALAAGLALGNGLAWSTVGRAVLSGIVLSVLGWLCYLPFYLGFQSQLGGILPNLLFPSRLSQFLLMFGPFLVVIVSFLVLLSRTDQLSQVEDPLKGNDVPRSSAVKRFLYVLPWVLLIPLVLWAFISVGLALAPPGRQFMQTLLDDPAVRANIGRGEVTSSPALGQLAGLILRVRVATPGTFLLLAVLIAWVAALIWVRLASRDKPGAQGAGFLTERLGSDLFALLMIGLALLLTLFVEFLYLRDLFGTRMNTVFKFYYQAWILFGLASAYGLSRLAARGTALLLKLPALFFSCVLVLGGLFYPLAAIPSKADDFRGQPTLDGLAYLRRSSPGDIAAIEWIKANVPARAVVLEATGGSYSPEGAGRVSMATGNPTLLGWDFHEMQWRGKAYEKLAAGRPEAINQIYRTARPEELPALLDTWGIDFVYVGPLERRKYGIGDAVLARFDSALKRVYDADGVTIYAR